MEVRRTEGRLKWWDGGVVLWMWAPRHSVSLCVCVFIAGDAGKCTESNFKWSAFHCERQKKGMSQRGSQAAQTEMEE